MTSKIKKARLALAERVREGLMTGGDRDATAAMAGRFITKLRKDYFKDPGENKLGLSPDDANKLFRQKFDQVDRIDRKIAQRRARKQGMSWPPSEDYNTAYQDSTKKFADAYGKGAGFYDDKSQTTPPKNSPVPTSVVRRLRGLLPYRVRR
jgi:hypothetical protein